ncbi:MAG: hypothetical protein HY940_04420 [Gammaproteobacteria bacterium]|nr:hypothetical protein [Gammaproteobacteria bacterium]
MKEHVIHIDWSGPYTRRKMERFKNKEDIGIYQVYGKHQVYGDDVLLYIGAARGQAFFQSIKAEGWNYERSTGKGTFFCLGRLRVDEAASPSHIDREILLAEKLLVFAHMPVYNSCRIMMVPDKRLRYLHVQNWGQYASMMPEVSGARWVSAYDAAHGSGEPSYDSH